MIDIPPLLTAYEAWRVAHVLVNTMASLALIFSLTCRLDLMAKGTTKKAFRWKYIALWVTTMLNFAAPFIPPLWALWLLTAMVAAMFLCLWSSSMAWNKGVPLYAQLGAGSSDFMGLDPLEHLER